MGDYRVPRELRERLIRERIEGDMAFGMPEHEARELATEMLEEATRRARESGAIDLPPGMGDRMLTGAATDQGIREMLDRKRAEGVTDDDYRWWWNMTEVERQMLVLDDLGARLGVFRYHTEQGRCDEEAWQIVRKAFPIYGNLDEVEQGSGDDRPLLYELKDRINILVNAGLGNPEEFKRRVESFSSFNAFIRAEMRANRLPSTPSASPPIARGTGCLLSLVGVVAAVFGRR